MFQNFNVTEMINWLTIRKKCAKDSAFQVKGGHNHDLGVVYFAFELLSRQPGQTSPPLDACLVFSLVFLGRTK